MYYWSIKLLKSGSNHPSPFLSGFLLVRSPKYTPILLSKATPFNVFYHTFYSFYDSIIFKKLQTVKIGNIGCFLVYFTPWKINILQKTKHPLNCKTSVEAENTVTKILRKLLKSGKYIKSCFGQKKMLVMPFDTLQAIPQFCAKYKNLLEYITEESFINIEFVVLELWILRFCVTPHKIIFWFSFGWFLGHNSSKCALILPELVVCSA